MTEYSNGFDPISSLLLEGLEVQHVAAITIGKGWQSLRYASIKTTALSYRYNSLRISDTYIEQAPNNTAFGFIFGVIAEIGYIETRAAAIGTASLADLISQRTQRPTPEWAERFIDQ